MKRSAFPHRFALALFLFAAPFALSPSPAFAQGGPGTYWLQDHGLNHWEWLIDHDGDTFNAAQEYAAGTDPFDDLSFLSLNITSAPPDIILDWDSILGALYQVLGSPDMVSFSPILAPIPGDGFNIQATITPPEQQNFYCLEALAPIDVDNDGLSAIEEAMLGTNPLISDTDRDSILDGDEVLNHLSDPLTARIMGGTVRGTLLTDPNNDGDLSDGSPVDGAIVYLDANYNGRLDPFERTETTALDGDYEFILVPPGVHHVRQELPAPNVQTFPSDAATPSFDGLPDEVVNYTHAAAGLGNFDVAYGKQASDWPANWGAIDNISGAEILDSVDVVLKPIGVRNLGSGTQPRHGTELLTLPVGAEITLRFDEPIVDGPGPDLVLYSYTGGAASEEVEVFLGATPASLASIGIFNEDLGTIPIDFETYGIPGPVHFVKCVGQDLGGSWQGFELTGFEALNIAPPDAGAHIVTVTSTEVFNDRDFGRHFRDLPPTVILGASDGVPATPGLRAGESLDVTVHAFDDIGIASLTLKANGQAVALGPANEANIPVTTPGSLFLEVSAIDTAAQTSEDSTEYYVLNPDGSFPFDPARLGQSENSNAAAPRVRILTPGPGTSFSSDVDIVANIIGTPAATSWTVEYADVNDVDPYSLTAPDSDYVQIGAGTGNVFSSTVATLPLSSLPDGIYFVRVCAENAPAQVACYGQVIARNVLEADLRPQVTIDSPTPGTEVTMTTDITGTITSTRPLVEWYVEYARADQVDLNNLNAADPDWIRIADGNNTVPVSALLANFDGTIVKNNGYVLRVVARNDIGLGWVEPLALEVTGEAKLGRNRLEFRDLSVNLAGFPLQFLRVYDSLQAEENGELGYGWAFSLQDPDIRETVPETGALGLFGSTPFRDGTRVYITAPTGERLGFTFKPMVGASSGFGSVYKAVFEPDLGNYHTLEIPEGDLAFLDLKADGSVHLFFFGFPYNPSRYVLTDPSGNRFTYHETKGFLQAEDRHGNRITLNEDGVDHSSGLSLRFERDGQDRITKVVDPEGGEWLYAYDAAGDLVGVTDPDLRTTTYAYFNSPAHYLDSITDPLGRMPVRYEYNPLTGRLDAIVDEAGNRREITWDPAGFTGSVRDRRGNLTQLEYDARGNVTRRIDPLLNETLYEYTDPANPDLETALVDARGERYESIYDVNGRITRYKLPLTTGIAGAGRYDFTYDADGNLTEVKDARTRQWNFTYDANGNLTEYEDPAAPTEINTYDASGRVIASEDATGEGYIVNYEYDANGLPTRASDSAGFQFEVALNRNGLPSAATDSNGGSYSFTYDGRGLPLAQQDPGGNSGSVAEMPDGSFDRTGRAGDTDNFMLASDSLLEGFTQANGGTITPAYDENRNLETLTDPNNNTTTYGYNAVDLLNSITDAAGNALTIDYNSVGNVSEIISRTGKRRTFEYDDNRQLTFERWHDGGGAVIREFAFTYNGGNGNLDQITDTAGAVVHLHNFSGRMPRPTSLHVTYSGQQVFNIAYGWGDSGDNAPGATSITVRRGFSQLGRILADYYGGRLYELNWNHPDSGNNTIQIRRNSAGDINDVTRITGLGGGAARWISRFGYDSVSRLQSIRHEDATGTGTLIHPDAEITYSFDEADRVATITTAGGTATAAYDTMSQLTGVTHTTAGFPDETYTYDLIGNRTSSHLLPVPAVVSAANRLASIGTFTYLYDLEGNISRRTDTTTLEETNFTYDHRNRLIQATVHPVGGMPASDTLNFEYDFMDRMISREINGTKTWILHDRLMPIAEFADGATDLNAMFFYSPQRPDAYHGVWRDGIGERWFLKDHLGSIRGITDETGNLLSWVDYDAFGNLQPGATPSNNEPTRYAGRPYLEEIGLYDNRRRFYDPLIGRFTQEDPVSVQSGDLNFYRYAFNNPHRFRDPLGTSAALEEGLLEVFTAQVEAFCAFGNCVGNLWSGVVRGVINLETTDAIGAAITCALDQIPTPIPMIVCDPYGSLQSQASDSIKGEIDAQWRFLIGGQAADVGKKATKIKEIVLQCAEDVTITTEEIEIPPADCSNLRGLDDFAGPYF